MVVAASLHDESHAVELGESLIQKHVVLCEGGSKISLGLHQPLSYEILRDLRAQGPSWNLHTCQLSPCAAGYKSNTAEDPVLQTFKVHRINFVMEGELYMCVCVSCLSFYFILSTSSA